MLLLFIVHQKEIIHHHLNNIKLVQSNEPNKCSIDRCVKMGSHNINNNYYCWYHRIDINLYNL